MLGNNMFTYCLNNPVAYSDSRGTDAKVCFASDGTIDEIPWWDHSPGGGGFVYHCANITTQYDGDKFLTQIALRYVKTGLGYMWEGVKDGATWLWDAYMRSYNLQQEAQLQQAIAINNVVEERFSTPQKALETISWCLDGVAILCYSGGHAIIGTAFEMIAWLLRGSAMYEPEA